MSALAEAEQVRPPTMTRLVGALERRGLVRRVSDAQDGRVQLVEATAAGRQLLNKGRARRVARLAEGLAQLSEDDQDLLAGAAELMDRLAAMG
jgi:DNA-binding MarR family transcriptional regulator